MTTSSRVHPSTSRRSFLTRAAAAAIAVPTAAALGELGPATTLADDDSSQDHLPNYAPIPKSALGPALNSDGYYVGQIQGNLYWVTDSHYQSMFLTTPEGVVLVDAPPTIGHNLQRAIDSVTLPRGRPNKVTHLVYSHTHADHIGASSVFGDNVIRIGHTLTADLLARDADSNRPAPTVTFDTNYVLEVGNETLQLDYHGPNHTPDNIFIFAPAQQTLMLVDVVFPGWVPFQNLAVSQDIPGWIQAHDVAMSYGWTTLVAGHLGRLGVQADVDVQMRYVADLRDAAKAALTAVDPTPFFKKYGPDANAWAIFKTYLDAIASQASEPVVAKYLGVLASVDVYTPSNASTMMEMLRIDAGMLGAFGNHP